MALKFQQPKQHNPKPAQPATKNPMLSELGFQSDEDSQESGSDSDAEKDKNEEGDEKGGISFIEYLTLQKSLRKVTDEKIGLTDQLKEAREQLKKAEVQARRATTNSRMQVSVLQNAQKNQTEDLNNVIAHLKSLIEEIEEKGNNANLKDHGVRQLTDDATRLAAEKRQWFEKAELNEGMLSQLKEEMAEAEKEYEEKIEALKTELKETRQKVDPAAVARAQAAQGNSTFNNAEIEALRKETADLRAKLRDVEYNAAHAPPAATSHTVSSADTERFTEQIKELSSKNKELKDELKDAHSQLAKLQAMSQSGSEKEQAQSKIYAELTEEANTLRKTSRDLQAKLEDISSKLRLEEQARQRAETEMADLKSNLEKELKTIQGSAAAGEESKKSVETRLQQTAQELAAERAAHKAEQNAHASIKKELDTARAQIAAARADMEQKSNDHGAELQKERERAATALQNAKAQAAIEIAEVKQRSKDDMKDLQERLDGFSERVKPMVAVIKALSKDYRALSKQSRDLQGEIAPAVKQCKRDLLRTLADIDTQYKEMITKYRKEMTLRKKLHNELVDLKGAIRVFARVRPLIEEDGKGPDAKTVTKFDNNDENLLIVESKGKDMVFEADHVFRPDGKQEDVFNAARDLIVSVIDGYNVCIFAYGQTGSGKTFTMDGTDKHPGLNRRALKELFDVMNEKKVDWSFEIEVSVMEIYNETLIDLLGDPKAKLEIRHGKLGPFVPDLSMHPVRTPEEVRERFMEAQKNRKTATTKMNFSSSRSHAMLVVYVTGTNLSTGVQTKGKLNLIDLAGSERVAKSGALDDEVRLKEATSINKSLSSLGDVIHALGTKQKHVPYRNSMLTHLLQDSLGGQAKTLMVVQVSPVLKNVEETMCSLNFAMRVRAVELGGSKRQTESAEVASLKKRIMELERGQA